MVAAKRPHPIPQIYVKLGYCEKTMLKPTDLRKAGLLRKNFMLPNLHIDFFPATHLLNKPYQSPAPGLFRRTFYEHSRIVPI